MYNKCFIILSAIMVAIEGQLNNYPCEIIKSKELKKEAEFLNGSILSDDILYPKEITFYDNGRIFGCICLIKICLQKCCPDHYSVNRNGVCFYNDKDIQINKYISLLLNTQIEFIFPSDNLNNHFTTIYQKTNKSLVEQTDLINYNIFNNGSILLKNVNNNILNINSYCLEWYEESQTITVFLYRNLNETNTLDKILNFLNIIPQFSKWNYLTVFLTLPLLCITFLTYYFIPELDNLFAKCLMCQLISAIFYCTFQFIFMNMNSEVKGLFYSITETCFFYGYISNYLWINILCYVLWLTFSEMVPAASNAIMIRAEEKKQFRKYLFYGWGLAFIICGPCRIMRFYILFTSNDDLENVVARLMVLCFGSVIVLVCFNTIKFFSLIRQIYKMNRQRKKIISDVNRHGRQAERNMLFLYFKFFFIMGIIRIPELLLTVYNYEDLDIIIISIVHFTEGLMTFVIFICKRRILHAVNYKLCPSLIIFKAEKHVQEPQMSNLSQQEMIISVATTTASSIISNNE